MATMHTDSLKMNAVKHFKSKDASFLVKSNILNVGIYINPQKWTFSRHKDNEVTPEYRISLKSEDGFAMLLSEKTQIDLVNLMPIALQKAQNAAVDAKIHSIHFVGSDYGQGLGTIYVNAKTYQRSLA